MFKRVDAVWVGNVPGGEGELVLIGVECDNGPIGDLYGGEAGYQVAGAAIGYYGAVGLGYVGITGLLEIGHYLAGEVGARCGFDVAVLVTVGGLIEL